MPFTGCFLGGFDLNWHKRKHNLHSHAASFLQLRKGYFSSSSIEMTWNGRFFAKIEDGFEGHLIHMLEICQEKSFLGSRRTTTGMLTEKNYF